MDSSAKAILENGTTFAKNLVTLQFLVNILSEIFSSPMYHARNREQPAPFAQANLADLYVQLCHRLGALSAACHREGKALEKRLPQQWNEATRPNDPARGGEDKQGESPHAADTNVLSMPDLVLATAPGQDRSQIGTSSSSVDLKVDEKTAAFKNLSIIRPLLFHLPQSINQFFHQLGHGLIGRKRLDAYQKRQCYRKCAHQSARSTLFPGIEVQFSGDTVF